MRRSALMIPLLATGAPLAASETINYTYDPRGRLVTVSHSGTVNNGVQTSYTLDKADNRLNRTVTGAAPTTPSFSIAAASAAEGSPLLFTVSRIGGTSSAASVDFSTADGTAAAGSDYTAANGTLNFAAGETSKTITVASSDDAIVESNESLLVNLANPSAGATITSGQATGTIFDNDAAPAQPAFSVSDTIETEGTPLVFTITKTGTASGTLTVAYNTANGTATAGDDYQAVSGTLTFDPGQTSRTVNVATGKDRRSEGSETLFLNLSNATGGATISDGQGLGTIRDASTSSAVTVEDGVDGESGAPGDAQPTTEESADPNAVSPPPSEPAAPGSDPQPPIEPDLIGWLEPLRGRISPG